MGVRDVGMLAQGWGGSEVGVGSGSDDRLLGIGAFASRARLSLKALRLYDRLGVLTPEQVDPSSGYRRYRESQLSTARLVAMLRRLDMPLAEVSQLVRSPGPVGADLLAAYWAAVENRLASQRELAAHLRLRLSGGASPAWPHNSVEVREVPQQTVLTNRRNIAVQDLSVWLGMTTGRLLTVAHDYGGVVAPTFVIYHGEVNHDSDGPVELCVPIAAANGHDAPKDVAATADSIRTEEAHREAYLRVRKAQVEYPQILSAFDAVAQWVDEQRLGPAGPPREVYFRNFQSAAAGDEVCDVAFPIN